MRHDSRWLNEFVDQKLAREEIDRGDAPKRRFRTSGTDADRLAVEDNGLSLDTWLASLKGRLIV